MREAIRNLLVQGVPKVDERVYEPHAMTAADGSPDIDLPALIVRELVNPAAPDGSVAGTNTLEVFVYYPRTSFVGVDETVEAVKKVLTDKVIEADGERYFVEYGRTGTDTPDRVFDAITRTVTFTISPLSWMQQAIYDPDPLEALRRWTEDTWQEGTEHGDVQTDPKTWQPSNESPGIYWRFVGSPRVIEHYPTHTWFEVRIQGHILVPDKAKRLEWIGRVHQALLLARKVTMEDGSPMFLVTPTADGTQNAITQGQIMVLAQFGVLKEPRYAEQPLERMVLAGNVTTQPTEVNG